MRKNSVSKDKKCKKTTIIKDVVYQLLMIPDVKHNLWDRHIIIQDMKLCFIKVWDGQDITTAVDTFAADFTSQKQ